MCHYNRELCNSIYYYLFLQELVDLINQSKEIYSIFLSKVIERKVFTIRRL